MTVEVPNSCPYYRYKPEMKMVTNCGGTVVFLSNATSGVCQSCRKEVPIILEM